MSLIQELIQVKPQKDSLISIGVLDGVHLGHQCLISHLNESARRKKYLAGVITFDRHPEEIIFPDSAICYLTTLEQRRSLLQSLAPHFVVVLPFTRDTAKMSARQFINLLQKHLRMKGLIIGPNFALGENREGNINTLPKIGQEMGFEIEVVPPLIVDGIMASSTTIREALHNGNIRLANKLLGRNFSLEGEVIAGTGQSTRIGFPTANLDIPAQLCFPDNGVYATIAHIRGQRYQSLTNISGPLALGRVIAHIATERIREQVIEVHLLDYSGDLKGTRVKIEFLDYLRPELYFDNTKALSSQISKDIMQAKVIFSQFKLVQEIK